MATTNTEQHATSVDGMRVNAITLALTLIAGLVVLIRIFAQLFMSRSVGVADAFIVLALVSVFGKNTGESQLILLVLLSNSRYHDLWTSNPWSRFKCWTNSLQSSASVLEGQFTT